MWNGYTWIDQTTYLETAGSRRARSDAVHRGGADVERPVRAGGVRVGADGHHLRAAGRRERSGSAARHRGHGDGIPRASVPASDDRLARRSSVDDARRPLRPLPPVLHPEQRHPRRRRRRRRGRGDAARGERTSAAIPPGAGARRGSATSSRRSSASGGCSSSAKARPATSRWRFTRRRRPSEDFFPMLVLDAVLTGAKGVNLWSSFRGAPPQRKARLYTALVERGLASIGVGRDPADGAAVPLYAVLHGDGGGRRSPRSRRRRSKKSSGSATEGVDRGELARAKRQLRARLVFENDSVTNIAHQLGYFETIAGPEFLPALQRRIDAVTAEQVWSVARRRLGAATRTVGWFRPLERRADVLRPLARGPVAGSNRARQRRGRHRAGDGRDSCRLHQRHVPCRQPLRTRRR